MSNMSHCRFRNTLDDLRDCHEAMNELCDPQDLSYEERAARHCLIKRCVQIANEYGDEVQSKGSVS